MNPRQLVAGLALLLCVAQVWSMPTENLTEEAGYVGDDAGDEGNEEGGDSASSPAGPVLPLTNPEVFVVERGSSVRLPCQFTNADEIAIEWKRGTTTLFLDDSKIVEDKERRLKHMPDNSIEIANVQEADAADEYECTALVGQDDKAPNPKIVHRIEVVPAGSGDEAYVIVTPSADNDVEQGANLTLGCEIHSQSLADKTESISFNREGHRLKVDEETRQAIRLRVTNATRHVAGDYQCLVEVGASKPLIKHLRLRVRHVPEIEYEKEQVGAHVRPKEHYFTGVGSSIVSQISCVVHSHPPVTKMHWLKNGQVLKIDGQHLTKSNEVKTHHVLTINGTHKSDLGEYRCRARNELGETTGPAIYLKDTPNQPIFRSGGPVEDSIELQWTVISYKPIVQADIVYRKQNEEGSWIEAKDVKVVSSLGKEHVIQGKIQGIAPGLYEARARARNDEEHTDESQGLEWGPYSDLKKFDGEYKDDADAASVRDSAVKPTVSLMTLLLFVLSPIVYSRL